MNYMGTIYLKNKPKQKTTRGRNALSGVCLRDLFIPFRVPNSIFKSGLCYEMRAINREKGDKSSISLFIIIIYAASENLMQPLCRKHVLLNCARLAGLGSFTSSNSGIDFAESSYERCICESTIIIELLCFAN